MPTLTTLLLFALVTFLLTASPGPGVLYVIARSLSQGRRAGFASMFGIESGEIVWLAAVGTGLAALLESSVSALTVLRFAGAAYLIYLGIQRWRSAEKIVTRKGGGLARLYGQGLVTQLVNPKVAVFFVAFLPQFISPDHAALPQIAILGVVYIGTAIAVDTIYVLTASALSRWFIRSGVVQKRIGRVSATTYVALGLAAATSGAKTLA